MHAHTNTRGLIPQAHQFLGTQQSQAESQGGVVVKPYGAPLPERLGDLTGGLKNTHSHGHIHTALIDL